MPMSLVYCGGPLAKASGSGRLSSVQAAKASGGNFPTKASGDNSSERAKARAGKNLISKGRDRDGAGDSSQQITLS